MNDYGNNVQDEQPYQVFYVLLTVHLSISLDNDQLDAHLLYFTICPLQSSTCFEHYMLIIRRLHCIDAASGIVLSVSGRPVHRLRENCRAVLPQPVQSLRMRGAVPHLPPTFVEWCLIEHKDSSVSTC